MSNSIETINPFTEEKLTTYSLISHQAAKDAVNNAEECFNQWKLLPIAKRAKLAKSLAKVIEENQDDLVQLMIDEMGKVQAQGE